MTAIKRIQETTRANLAAADNGDDGPCRDAGIRAAEILDALLVLVLCEDASPERVESRIGEVMASW